MHKQTGISLIEVMVTVLILASTLMALAALQTRSLQYNTSAYMRSQANIIAYDIMDQIRIKSPTTGAAAVPSESDRKAMVAGLPAGEADADCTGRICTVSISWTDPGSDKDAEGEDSEKTTFSYQTRV